MKRFSKMFSVIERGAFALGGEGHVLRLHVGGEAGVFFGRDVDGFEVAFAANAERVGADGVDARAGVGEPRDDCAEMSGVAVGDAEVAAGDCAGDEEGSGLDAVGVDAVFCAVELVDSLDADGRRARALDLRAHGGEQRGEVGDFGFAGAVLEERFALGEDGGHEQVFGAGDGDLVEDDVRALEAFGAGLDVAVLVADDRAHAFESLDVQVDGAAADGAASGHGDAGEAGAGDEGAEDQRRSAHGLDDLVFRGRVGEDAARDGSAMLGAAVAELDFAAHGGEQLALGLDVLDLGDVFENDFVFGEDGGGHAGQGGVFCAADADGAKQRIAAANYEFIHNLKPVFQIKSYFTWASGSCGLKVRRIVKK